MCGIAGRFNFVTGAPVDEHMVRGMCGLIAHRGPDGEGVWTDGSIGLGHRRLAVIDLSPAGVQPMATTDGALWITFNGEIYNFLDLRRELEQRGHRFVSRTDTEVLLASYREYGFDCVNRLLGMFAFAIWDAPRRRLFIARDRFGKKPLFYHRDADGIAFASEPKAFFADPNFQTRPDLDALSDYLSYEYVPSPRSAFAGVSKLPPAHYLVVTDSGVRVERYWKLSYGRKCRVDEETACEELRHHLREAVRARLLSDVPLGAFLSGGVDSSAVVALMADAGGPPVKTFSIGFEEETFNELPYAREVARRYATDHHEFVVRPEASEIFSELVWHYNEPYADASAIPTYYLSRLTRQYVTVALNGDAGDENFGGYRRYLPTRTSRLSDIAPAAARRAVGLLARGLPAGRHSASLLARGKSWGTRFAADPAERYARRMTIFSPEWKNDLCTASFMEAVGGRESLDLLATTYRHSDGATAVDAMTDVDVNHYLPDCLLVKVDIATMAHGLEGRSPLLDHRLVEFAATLPSTFKVRGTTTKYIFKRAVRDLVPRTALERPKHGFSVPLHRWFRNELRELTQDLLLDGRLAARGYFHPAVVRRLVDEHVTGVAGWQAQLWTLLMLESWHRMFVDARPTPPARRTNAIHLSPAALAFAE